MATLTVYIDEAGDPGVRDGLQYIGKRHEWMEVAAVVVRSSREPDIVHMVKKLREAAASTQAGSLHYNTIRLDRRKPVCSAMASLPCRAFVLASHKSNLREYVNPRIKAMISGGTFYNWCLRLLLERVTAWAATWQHANLGQLEPLRVVFAQRGHDWDHFMAYVDRLRMQAETKTLFLKGPGLAPELLNRGLWSVEQAAHNAGLQLSDVIASAFYQGCNAVSPNFDPNPAITLSPIMPVINGSAANCSVTLFPLPAQAPIPPASRPLFEHYGYKF